MYIKSESIRISILKTIVSIIKFPTLEPLSASFIFINLITGELNSEQDLNIRNQALDNFIELLSKQGEGNLLFTFSLLFSESLS